MIDVKNWDRGKNISKIKVKKTSVIKEYLNFLRAFAGNECLLRIRGQKISSDFGDISRRVRRL